MDENQAEVTTYADVVEAARLERIASVEREYEALVAERSARRDEADAEPRRSRGRGRQPVVGPSTVYSVRLDHHEVAALERRAAALGIPPSALARNLIRIGVARPMPTDLAHTVDRLERAVAELRTQVS